MTRITINYRRDDTSPWAGRLYDRLVQEFGRDQVFMDIDTLEPGVDFVEEINKVVSQSHVLVAMIGPQWTTAVDSKGNRRLNNPMDFVRLELVAALERKIRVVPVLVGGAVMPSREDLPEDLAALSRRHAIEVSDGRFHSDVDRLIESIRRVLERVEPEAARAETPKASPEPERGPAVAVPTARSAPPPRDRPVPPGPPAASKAPDPSPAPARPRDPPKEPIPTPGARAEPRPVLPERRPRPPALRPSELSPETRNVGWGTVFVFAGYGALVGLALWLFEGGNVAYFVGPMVLPFGGIEASTWLLAGGRHRGSHWQRAGDAVIGTTAGLLMWATGSRMFGTFSWPIGTVWWWEVLGGAAGLLAASRMGAGRFGRVAGAAVGACMAALACHLILWPLLGEMPYGYEGAPLRSGVLQTLTGALVVGLGWGLPWTIPRPWGVHSLSAMEKEGARIRLRPNHVAWWVTGALAMLIAVLASPSFGPILLFFYFLFFVPLTSVFLACVYPIRLRWVPVYAIVTGTAAVLSTLRWGIDVDDATVMLGVAAMVVALSIDALAYRRQSRRAVIDTSAHGRPRPKVL